VDVLQSVERPQKKKKKKTRHIVAAAVVAVAAAADVVEAADAVALRPVPAPVADPALAVGCVVAAGAAAAVGLS
jgi:hypothetical protein